MNTLKNIITRIALLAIYSLCLDIAFGQSRDFIDDLYERQRQELLDERARYEPIWAERIQLAQSQADQATINAIGILFGVPLLILHIYTAVIFYRAAETWGGAGLSWFLIYAIAGPLALPAFAAKAYLFSHKWRVRSETSK